MIGRYGPPVFQILRGIEGAYNVALIMVTHSLSITRECLYYFLKQESLFQLIESLSRRSSGQTGVEMSALKSYGVPLPSHIEQRAIVEALSDADALIESLEQLIAKKRDVKQAAMQQLLTGQRRLPGFSGEWEPKRLGNLGSTYGGLSGKTKHDFGEGNARYIPFLNIMNNVVIDSNQFESVRVSSLERQNQAMKGDLFFKGSSETPEEVGMCSVLLDNFDRLYLNSFCFGFRLREPGAANGKFLA